MEPGALPRGKAGLDGRSRRVGAADRRLAAGGVLSGADVRADGRVEPPLLTSGDDLAKIGSFLKGRVAYTAADVIDYLLSGVDG